MLCFRGDHLILREGRAGKFCQDRLFYFQHELDQKIYFQVYQGQTIYFYPQQNFEKAKKKKHKKKNTHTHTHKPREGGGGQNVGSEGYQDQGQDFPWDFFFIFAHYQVLYVHIYYSI